MNDKRFPASQACRLENPERLVWLPPDDVLAAIGVRTGDHVADVGAGTGYFTFPLLTTVGSDGKVFAIDAQVEMLSWIKEKLTHTAFANAELIHADAGKTALPDASCDLFFLADLWHEIEDRDLVIKESLRVLRKRGRIAILDWRTDVEAVAGPPLAHRIAPSDVLKELQQYGYGNLSSLDAGRYSWLVQGEKTR